MRGVAPEASAQRACACTEQRAGAGGRRLPRPGALTRSSQNYAKLIRADDTTAGWVIVEEAGGHFTDFTGASTAGGGSGLSCNVGPIHAELLALLG
jgi:Inositol monophosphatase family